MEIIAEYSPYHMNKLVRILYYIFLALALVFPVFTTVFDVRKDSFEEISPNTGENMLLRSAVVTSFLAIAIFVIIAYLGRRKNIRQVVRFRTLLMSTVIFPFFFFQLSIISFIENISFVRLLNDWFLDNHLSFLPTSIVFALVALIFLLNIQVHRNTRTQISYENKQIHTRESTSILGSKLVFTHSFYNPVLRIQIANMSGLFSPMTIKDFTMDELNKSPSRMKYSVHLGEGRRVIILPQLRVTEIKLLVEKLSKYKQVRLPP